MISRKNLFLLLLAFCLLAVPLWHSAFTVSAQDGSDDALSLLEKDAAKKQLTLGEYLWKMLSGKYPSLGDLAAGSLEKFLEKGESSEITLGGEVMTITIVSGDDTNTDTGHEAYYTISLKKDDGSESGWLLLHMDAIRDYVNDELYPQMLAELEKETSESQLKQDLGKLLQTPGLMPKSVSSAWNAIWEELSQNLSDYAGIRALLNTPSEEPLITIIVEDEGGTQGESSVLEELFPESDVFSGADILDVFAAANINPIPDEIADKVEDRIDNLVNGGSDHQGSGGRPDGWFLVDTVLPATGFSTCAPVVLREQPLSLSYGQTGMVLQIPKLNVSEMILSVPLDGDSYPVEWLERNAGLLSESAMPGNGVTVLTGHNHLNAEEAGPFLFISTLENDDRIFITGTDGALYTYAVYGNYRIPADGFASAAGDLHENTLVLITCEDESMDGGYLNRRVIFADPL